MLYQSIAVLCVLAVQGSFATDENLDIPFIGGARLPFKRPYFGSRYAEINSQLMKRAKSDEPADVIEAAKEYNYELKESKSKSGELYTTKEASIQESLEHFITLDKVVEDLANKECTRRSQNALEWGERHTNGKVYKTNLKNDRYAGTVRKLILQRAELCQDNYPKSVSYDNVLGYFNQSLWESVGETYIKFTDKLVADLKGRNKFVPYVIPKQLVKERLGEYMYYTIIEMAKIADDKRGEELEALTIDRGSLGSLVESYIYDNSKVLGWIGDATFAMASLDKKVAGRDVKFSWENDETFVRRLEAYLFKAYILEHQSECWNEFVEFLMKHQGGKYAYNFPERQKKN